MDVDNYLWRGGGGDFAGGAGAIGEVGVEGVAEDGHGRAGLVVVEGRDVIGVGDIGDDPVERVDELVVDLPAPAQGLVRHRRVGAGEDVVQRGAALPRRPENPLVHGHAGVTDHAETWAKACVQCSLVTSIYRSCSPGTIIN